MLHKEHLTYLDFLTLSRFLHQETGIKLPESKRTMLEGRLRKRLQALGMQKFSQYCVYVFSPEGQQNEVVHLMDVVTTNKTDFFREPGHFQILVNNILPQMLSVEGSGIRRKLMVWSAGCSSGEEPYTIAMVLSDFGERFPGFQFDFLVLATDLSSDVLEQGQHAVYTEEAIATVPMEMRKKYLLRHKDSVQQKVRIIPALRNRVKFRRLNFLERDFGMREPVDLIFYRNVMIYFDRPTQEKILNNIVQYLRPGGFIFLGHSENINGLNVHLNQVYPTVFKKY